MKITSYLVIYFFIFLNSVIGDGVQGYYPVSSNKEEYYAQSPGKLPHNPLYEEWCKQKFFNGGELYDAYRTIAFGIKYIPESPRVDRWQTPSETIRRGTGDCEDAILLFSHLTQSSQGEVIWGIVQNLPKNIRYAHVWFQIRDIHGYVYILEPFSNDWNGIIPADSLSNQEIRGRIVWISNQDVNNIMEDTTIVKEIKKVVIKQVVMHDWRLINLIDDVFAKLTQVSERYLKQKH